MAIQIALLRGINVGGKNKIKMADLRAMFESMGLAAVKTYIQSGNVLFESDEDEMSLRNRIEKEIEKVFGMPVTVILRTAADLERVIRDCPFSKEEIEAAEAVGVGESLYVTYLLQEPTQEQIERIGPLKLDGDECRVHRRELYLLFRYSIRDSKLANNTQKLGAPATVRNWKTTNKLLELAKAEEEK